MPHAFLVCGMCEQLEVEGEPVSIPGVHEAPAALSVLAAMSSEEKDNILFQVGHSL